MEQQAAAEGRWWERRTEREVGGGGILGEI